MRLTWMSGTASTNPSTPWSASRDIAPSTAEVSRDSVVAAATEKPASDAARSMPYIRLVRE